MADMISIRALTKHFGSIRAVDGVTLSVARGEVLGFLGPNGAGKSTTMKMLAGFLTPTSGQAAICGFDVQSQPIEAKKRLGYLPEGAPSYPDMTPSGFLKFIAGIRGLSGRPAQAAIAQAVERANLAAVLHQPIDTLSKGFKRRVGLAQALLHDPDVLVLDEPTDGLDPNQKHEVRALIQDMAVDKAIIVSTHILEEVEAVCTRAVIIARGRVVADGTPAELVARDPSHNAILLTLPPAEIALARQILVLLPGVSDVVDIGEDGLMIHAEGNQPLIAEIARLAREHNWTVRELRTERGRLDAVFRSITSAA